MFGRSTWLRRAAVAAAATVVAGLLAACQGGNGRPRPSPSTTLRSVPTITQGGDISVAAEGEPGCMDWISTCAGSSWGVWTVETNTLPRAYDYTRDNLYKPSILLTGDARVQTDPAQVVTYHLNPRAVWSDGQPITSHDFTYTWDQIAHGPDILDASGYDAIATVDDSDPQVVVVTFTHPYADWRKLFGGPFGVLPSHLLEGRDRDALMKDGYTWSGGPWELDPGGWQRGQSIRLVPNLDYWGKKPNLASVTFRIYRDDSSALQAYTAGEVVAVYPAPEPAAAAYRTLPGTLDSVTDGLDLVALWFDLSVAPLNSKAVRQAVASSLDRATLATNALGVLMPKVAPLQELQDLLTPAYGSVYTEAFAGYGADLATVAQLMVTAGWAKGADGVWTKSGLKAAIDIKVSTASPLDEELGRLIQAQLDAAGFSVTVSPVAPDQLLAEQVPAGMFSAAIYPLDLRRVLAGGGAVAGSGISDNDPGQCRRFCSSAIRTGSNFTRLADLSLDRYLSDLDANLNDAARVADAQQAAGILADVLPAIPLATLPDTLVVNTTKLGVEGGTFNHNLAYGPYSYLNEWFLK